MTAKQKPKKKSSRRSILLLLLLFLVSLLFLSQLQSGKISTWQWPDWFSPAGKLATRSLLFEESINQALADAGLSDADIITASTQEHTNGGHSWYYFEKQLKLPSHLDLYGLQSTLLEAVRAQKGQILENRLNHKDQELVLHLKIGFKQQITHYLIIGQLAASAEASTPYQVALIIDDVGNNEDIKLLDELGIPLTVAILPQLDYTAFSARHAKEQRYATFLHLPLEPVDPTKNPGPGLIKTSMSEEEILAVLDQNLADVPGVVGVNGHMGSLATTSRRTMEIILRELKKRDLIYLDSLVVKDSVGPQVALELGVPTFTRDVFIDNIDEVNYVKKQLEELLNLALEKGQAVGIGHIYHESTRTALRQMLPVFAAKDVSFVPITALSLRRTQHVDNGY